MLMELTKGKMQEAKGHGVPVGYIVMADLMAAGYCEQDAYVIAFPENATLAAQMNKSIRENIASSHKFKMLYEEKAGKKEDAGGDGGELIGKEATARMILSAALSQPNDSKEKAELLMKYSDIMGFKKEEVEDKSADCITFYMPATCNLCPLLSEYNKQAQDKVRPVDMGRVMRNAGKIIGDATD